MLQKAQVAYDGDPVLVSFAEFDDEGGKDDGGERGNGRYPEELRPLLPLQTSAIIRIHLLQNICILYVCA